MSDSNFEPFDGEWEDNRGELSWTEFQWRKYLNNSDRDTARFLSVYNTVKDRPNHLDEAAMLMGWDVDDISLTDDFNGESADNAEGAGAIDDGDPYTMHRHPVFIVTRALFRYLLQSWEHVLKNGHVSVSPLLCWRYSKALHHGEVNATLAIQALDLGDFGLVICHLKIALATVNEALGLLDEMLVDGETDSIIAFKQEMRIRLFDLRELWLRVMGDCRSESIRRNDGPEEL